LAGRLDNLVREQRVENIKKTENKGNTVEHRIQKQREYKIRAGNDRWR